MTKLIMELLTDIQPLIFRKVKSFPFLIRVVELVTDDGEVLDDVLVLIERVSCTSP